MTELIPGQELWSVATGRVSLWRRSSRKAAEFMGEQEGFIGAHIIPDGRMLWFYASENAAKAARNNAEAQGIECGKNIAPWRVSADGVPEAMPIDGGTE